MNVRPARPARMVMANNWSFGISLRYLSGKGAANAVPVLSRISMGAIAVASAAMIITFSVFNGLEYLVKDMYKAFYPDVRITAAKGKFFSVDAATMKQLRGITGVDDLTCVIEDNALATDNDEINGSNNKQKFVTVKGVDNNYFKINKISASVEGTDTLVTGLVPSALIGGRISKELGVGINNDFRQISLYYPNAEVINPEANPENAFQQLKLRPRGIYYVSDEFDDKYVIAPLEKVQHLLRAAGKYSSIELSTLVGKDNEVKQTIAGLLGPAYRVETRYEQNRTVFMMMSIEKYVIYIIFLFILFIASFNMVGALFMLVIEKRKDIGILRALGAPSGSIRAIFLAEGMLWGAIGGAIGLALGCTICAVQQYLGVIKLPGNFVTDIYPMRLALPDVLLVGATIVFISACAAWFPAAKAAKAVELSLKSN